MSSAIRKFHEKYFEILEDYFGRHYEKMKRKGQTILEEAAHEATKTYNKTQADSVSDALFEELDSLDWNSIENNIRQQDGIKTLVSAPTYTLGSAKSVQRLALYADTIVFSGTILQSRKHVYKTIEPSLRIQTIIRTSLGLLKIRDLFLTDITPPIAILARPVAFSNSGIYKTYEELQEHDGLDLFSDIFGRRFSSRNEIQKFILRHRTVDDLCKGIKKPDFFVEPGSSLKKEFEFCLEVEYKTKPHLYTNMNDPNLLVSATSSNVFGAIGIINSQLISCGFLRAKPVMEDIHRWRHLMWKLEHDNKFFAERYGFRGISRNSLIINTLQLDNFKWLGNIPLDGIVKMREEGELQNLRDLLSRGVREIETVNDEDFAEVTKYVSYNLNQAFKRHRTQVKRLNEKFRQKYDFDVATLVVGGCIGMMSALFPPFAMAIGILGGAVGGGSMIQIARHIEEERSERRELQMKPVGLLFRAYQDSEIPKTRA